MCICSLLAFQIFTCFISVHKPHLNPPVDHCRTFRSFYRGVQRHLPADIPDCRIFISCQAVQISPLPNPDFHFIHTVTDFLPCARRPFYPLISCMFYFRSVKIFQRLFILLGNCRLLLPLFCRRFYNLKDFLLITDTFCAHRFYFLFTLADQI